MKKFLMISATLLLSLLLVPIGVYAAECADTEQDAQSVAKIVNGSDTKYCDSIADAVNAVTSDNALITVLKDTTINSEIQLNDASKKFTVDFGGNTVTVEGSIVAFRIKKGTVTFKGTTGGITGTVKAVISAEGTDTGSVVNIESGHYVTNTTGEHTTSTLQVADKAKLTISGGTISGRYGIGVFDTAEIVINDGKIEATRYGLATNGEIGYENAVTINGGEIIGGDAGIYHPDKGTLTIKGGSIQGKNGIVTRQGQVIVESGTIKGTGTGESISYGDDKDTQVPTGVAIVLDNTNTSYGNDPTKDTVSIINGNLYGTKDVLLDLEKDDKVNIKVSGGTSNMPINKKYLAEGKTQSINGTVGDEAKLHNIKLAEVKNGTASVNENYFEGDKVYVNAIANNGYVLDKIIVTTKSGKEVKVIISSNGGYFTMPGEDVTVSVTFKKAEQVVGINPDTVDGIATYIIMEMISLISIAGITIKGLLFNKN